MSAVNVGGLSDIKLPWLVRLRLRRVRKDQRTGVLLYGLIRTSVRSTSRWAPAIYIHEGKRLLYRCSNISKLPKWADLEPGAHNLRLHVSRRASASEADAASSLRRAMC